MPPNVLALTNNGPSPFELPTGLGSSPANPTHLNPAISLQPPSADFYPPTPPPKQRFPPQRRPQQKFEHFPDRFEAAEDASVVRKRNIQPEASRSLFDQSDEVLEFRRQKQKVKYKLSLYVTNNVTTLVVLPVPGGSSARVSELLVCSP